MPLPGQGKRIQQLILELAAALGRRVTLGDYGELVGKREKGRNRPYQATTVSEWIQNRNEPSFAAVVAMSAISQDQAPPGHSEAWIAFGTEAEPAEQLRATPIKRVDVAAEKKKRRGA